MIGVLTYSASLVRLFSKCLVFRSNLPSIMIHVDNTTTLGAALEYKTDLRDFFDFFFCPDATVHLYGSIW
jgi:hypothetical protein